MRWEVAEQPKKKTSSLEGKTWYVVMAQLNHLKDGG
jgi:hypothetical protein